MQKIYGIDYCNLSDVEQIKVYVMHIYITYNVVAS